MPHKVLKACQACIIPLPFPKQRGIKLDHRQAVVGCPLPGTEKLVVAEQHKPDALEVGSGRSGLPVHLARNEGWSAQQTHHAPSQPLSCFGPVCCSRMFDDRPKNKLPDGQRDVA